MPKKSNWYIEPIAEGVSSGCVNCGNKPLSIKMNRPLAVGFGNVGVTYNGKHVWSGDDISVTIMRFENMARKKPGDWRVQFDAPMWSGTYQRHGRNQWNLIEKGLGFA